MIVFVGVVMHGCVYDAKVCTLLLRVLLCLAPASHALTRAHALPHARAFHAHASSPACLLMNLCSHHMLVLWSSSMGIVMCLL